MRLLGYNAALAVVWAALQGAIDLVDNVAAGMNFTINVEAGTYIENLVISGAEKAGTMLLAENNAGIGAKTIKNDADVMKGMGKSMSTLGLYLVLDRPVDTAELDVKTTRSTGSPRSASAASSVVGPSR